MAKDGKTSEAGQEPEEIEIPIDEEAELFHDGVQSFIMADETFNTIMKLVNTEIMWQELKQHRT